MNIVFFYIFFSFFFFKSFLKLLFEYSCHHFPIATFSYPHPFPLPHPQSYPPLALSVCPLYMFRDDPSPTFPIIPSCLPSGYCQFVLNFNVSDYILLVCLLIRFHL